MKVYVGQTRSRTLIARLVEMGYGEMTVRGELPPRRTPWALDNGAYRDWTAGVPFDAAGFRESLATLGECLSAPDFVVCPDVIAGGDESLRASRAWLPELRSVGVRVALVAQDGMTLARLSEELESYDILFVGGTLGWKIATAPSLVRLAHRANKQAHIGRVGTFPRVVWARRIGADSIDSCLPLWSTKNLARFDEALAARQREWSFVREEHEGEVSVSR